MEIDYTERLGGSDAVGESPCFKMAILAEDLERAERWCRKLNTVLQARARCCDDVPPLEIAARTLDQGLPDAKHHHWVHLLDDPGLSQELVRSLKTQADCITVHQLAGSGRAIPEIQSLAWSGDDEAIDFLARMLSGVMQMSGVMHNLDWADYLEVFSAGGHCQVRTAQHEDLESAVAQLLENPEVLCNSGNSALLLMDDRTPPSLHQYAEHANQLEMAFGHDRFIKAHLDWQPDSRWSQAWLVIGHRAESRAKVNRLPAESCPIEEIEVPEFVKALAKQLERKV